MIHRLASLAVLSLAAAAFGITSVAQTAPVGTHTVYKQVDGRSLALYIDAPPTQASAHSAIVFFHGGAWTMGEVSQFNQQAAYLASRGMTAIQVEYRLLDKSGNEPPRICVEDAKSAMRWVRAHAAALHIDADRIVAAGGSAGGYLAAAATMIPGWDAATDNLQISPRGNALVLFNPVVDGGPAGFGYKRFGDSYQQYSPAYHVDRSMPPTLIQSGDADKLVSPDSLRAFQQKAQAAGVRCELVFYPGQPHSFFTPEPYTTQSLAVAAKFLDSLHLLLPGAPPAPPQLADWTEAKPASSAGVATVDVDTTHRLAVPPRTHFAGANMQLFLTGSSYLDAALQQSIAQLAPGWVRFPGGTIDDVYDWQTGEVRPEWIAKFQGTKGVAHGEMLRDAEILAGKGPITLADYSAFLQSQPQRPSTIGVINTLTDTPEAAEKLVSQAKASGVQVDVWELGNEPFFFPSFYADATAYLKAVEPYAAAARRADPQAKLAVYLQRNDAWIDQLASYPHRFWDELYWHPYPTRANGTRAEQIAFYNNFLLNFSNRYLDETLAAKFGSDYKIEISEYNIGALRGGLFGALFVTEYAMRLSRNPHVTHVGMHILVGAEQTLDAAILPSHDHVEEAVAAGKAGKPISLKDASFGYYKSPYGLALQLLDPAINQSLALYSTSATGGAQVSAQDGSRAAESMPAIFAQAYQEREGVVALLLTNKSAEAQQVAVQVNGKGVAGPFEIEAFGGADPLARNTSADPDHITLHAASAHGTVIVPPFGVMSLRWHN